MVDYLSRDFYLSDKFLTNLLFAFYQIQLPHSFRIFPLSKEITLYIIRNLEALPIRSPRPMLPILSILGARLIGLDFSSLLDLEYTN